MTERAHDGQNASRQRWIVYPLERVYDGMERERYTPQRV